MTVQDDERERELCRMFNLEWDPVHQRAGRDAELIVEVDGRRCHFDVEVKSTTNATVSTARDVSMEHIERWRRMLFVIGFYSRDAKRPEFQRCLCLTPMDMEPWIASIEAKILIDFKLASLAAERLLLEDLFSVCGEQEHYSLEDAKRLHKSQWTSLQYEQALDIVDSDGHPRISQIKMLEILRLRSKYISERGATLNNPHITKSHLDSFFGTDREIKLGEWASGIRKLASSFALEHPTHPAITVLAN
jgi:hypothetical protein